MSHFFIASRNASYDEKSVDALFHKMHLERSTRLLTSTHSILVYFKANKQTDNDCFFSKGNDRLFVSGTFFYRDLSFAKSLETFYQDCVNDNIDYQSMHGQFALVAIINDTIRIFNDALGCHRIFSTHDQKIISTSFLATWYSLEQPATIDLSSLREKALGGYIVYPKTLVNEVADITYESFEGKNLFKYRGANLDPELLKDGKDVRFQALSLRDYFRNIVTLSKGNNISLGVSAGFDSRLLLSLIKDLPSKYLYTHLTKGVHNKEARIAKKLASVAGAELHIEETEKPDALPLTQQQALLDELIYYYDGRTANNSGAFSFTGTYDYNLDHLRHVYVGLNGKGGEVYRNYYQLGSKSFDFAQWYNDLVWYPSAAYMLDRSSREKLLSGIGQRISRRLEVKDDRWGRWQIHRYYSEVRQPDCEGSIISAHNKITHYLSPFFDHNVIMNAYQSFSKMGGSDLFQANLIRHIDRPLAEVPSKYGYNFVDKSLKYRLKSFIAREMPHGMKQKKKKVAFQRLLGQSKQMDELQQVSLAVLQAIDPGMKWEYAFYHYAQKNVCMNLARLLQLAQSQSKLQATT